jgi:hypothetical protein
MVGGVGVGHGHQAERPHIRALMDARRREERRRNITVIAIVVLLVLLLAAFAYRPATVIGVHGGALAHSVRGSAGLGGQYACVAAAGGRWRCQAGGAAKPGAARYTVTTSGPFGCWTARRLGSEGNGATPKHASGCIDVADVISAS